MRILIDGGISHAQNVAARTLVLIEDHCLGLREPALEFLEGSAGGAAETVDGLVGITDGKNVLFHSSQQFCKRNVAGVAVLKFVDQNETRATALLLQKLSIGLQQPDRPADHHAEGAQVLLLQQAHDVRVHAGDFLPARQHLRRAQLLDLLGFTVARQVRAGLQGVHVSLELLRPDQLFVAAVKQIAQVIKKLSYIGRLDKTLKAELPDPLPQENVNVFRN